MLTVSQSKLVWGVCVAIMQSLPALPTKSAFFILLSSDIVHKDAPLEAILSQCLLPGKPKLRQYIFTFTVFSESGSISQINIAFEPLYLLWLMAAFPLTVTWEGSHVYTEVCLHL